MPSSKEQAGTRRRLKHQAEKARLLARTMAGDRAAKRLEEIAEELDAEADKLACQPCDKAAEP